MIYLSPEDERKRLIRLGDLSPWNPILEYESHVYPIKYLIIVLLSFIPLIPCLLIWNVKPVSPIGVGQVRAACLSMIKVWAARKDPGAAGDFGLPCFTTDEFEWY